MCMPYIKLVEDPPAATRKRPRPSNPKLPLSSSESMHPHPIIVELSPRLVYAPSTSRSNSQRIPRRRPPSAPHPSPATPQAEFVGGFEAGYQLRQEEQEQGRGRLAAEERGIAEEGRAGPSGTGPQPQMQQPLTTDPAPKRSSAPQAAPQSRPLPAQEPAAVLQSQPAPPAPAVTAPQREHTRSPYSYIRRPQPNYRNRSRNRSRSSSDSSISRRSFQALRRRVNALTDRLTRLERWRDEVVSERLGRLERWKEEREMEARGRARPTVRMWSLGPGGRRRLEERGKDRNVDERRDGRRDGREEWGRWDWEGGGLGRR